MNYDVESEYTSERVRDDERAHCKHRFSRTYSNVVYRVLIDDVMSFV